MRAELGRARRAACAAALIAAGLGCASASPPPAVDASKCESGGGPTEEPGGWWCGLTCSAPRASARCQGPRGRPVACICTGGDVDRIFAVDRCEALDAQRVVQNCAVR